MFYATKEEKNSYVQGFIDGLKDKLDRQSEQLKSESNELMILVPAEVTDYVTTNTSGTRKVSFPSSFDAASYLSGLDEGSTAEILTSRLVR